MAELLASPAFWGSLATLTFLEVVLGIDNLLFISIATGKLKGEEQKRAARTASGARWACASSCCR